LLRLQLPTHLFSLAIPLSAWCACGCCRSLFAVHPSHGGRCGCCRSLTACSLYPGSRSLYPRAAIHHCRFRRCGRYRPLSICSLVPGCCSPYPGALFDTVLGFLVLVVGVDANSVVLVSFLIQVGRCLACRLRSHPLLPSPGRSNLHRSVCIVDPIVKAGDGRGHGHFSFALILGRR
jgi:hypothetical protein